MGGVWRVEPLLLIVMYADHERLLADGFVVSIACIIVVTVVTVKDGQRVGSVCWCLVP